MKPSTLFGVISIIGAIFWIPLPNWASAWAMSGCGFASIASFLMEFELEQKKRVKEAAK